MIADRRHYPKLLMACCDNSFDEWRQHYFIGRLITPPLLTNKPLHGYTAMDNFCFTGLQKDKFFRMLEKYAAQSSEIKWVCCPDKVGDWVETRRLFDVWSTRIKSFGYKLAYVLQDGQPVNEIPWGVLSCIFLGGTDSFKLSKYALEICSKGIEMGKHVHVGRVNSVTRLSKFWKYCHSFDGSNYSRWSRASMPRLIAYYNRRVWL